MGNWDERYKSAECFLGAEPAPFLAEYAWLWQNEAQAASVADRTPDGSKTGSKTLSGSKRKALDVATGEGRNAVFIARHGFHVTGVDQSSIALDRCRKRAAELNLQIDGIEADLLQWEFQDSQYDLIVCINYLERILFPKMKRALRPSGWLVCETFTESHLKYHPINPDYVLKSGELLKLFSSFRILVYREIDLPDKKKAVASLIACKEA